MYSIVVSVTGKLIIYNVLTQGFRGFFYTQELKYNLTLSAENEHEYTCPITRHEQETTAKYAEEVRRNSRAQAQGSCPNKKQEFAFSSNK